MFWCCCFCKTLTQLKKMLTQGLYRWAKPAPFPPTDITTPTIRWTIPLPGVLLFHVCAKPRRHPAQVTNLQVYNITTNQVLLTWSDTCVHAKCIWTYEVEFSHCEKKTHFQRINNEDTIFNCYLYTPGSYAEESSGIILIGCYNFSQLL